MCILLVGNKIDDTENRKVTKEQGEQLAKDFEINFIETSAKNDINVAEAFTMIANSVYKSFFESNETSSTTTGGEKEIKLGKTNESVKNNGVSCCSK